MQDWHRTVEEIGSQLTREQSRNGEFIVEYNSKFGDVSPGIILEPAGRRSSSLDIVTKCDAQQAQLIRTSGNDFGVATGSRNISFESSGSAVPPFLNAALSSLKAGLSLDRKRAVSLSISDISMDQLSQVESTRIVNSDRCLRDLVESQKREVFLVRGLISMRMNFSQTSSGTSAAQLNAEAEKNLSAVNFKGKVDSDNNWSLEQKTARPWFRIVSRYTYNSDKKKFELSRRR